MTVEQTNEHLIYGKDATITVKDWRGEKKVNLEQYLEVWADTVADLPLLVNRDGDWDQIKDIKQQVKQLAIRNFWTLHRRERLSAAQQ